jgi:hypothetical protein
MRKITALNRGRANKVGEEQDIFHICEVTCSLIRSDKCDAGVNCDKLNLL